MRELSLNVMDIAQNSLSAGASLTQIVVEESSAEDTLTLKIIDNGRGMTAEQAARVTDPFSQPAPPERWGWECRF